MTYFCCLKWPSCLCLNFAFPIYPLFRFVISQNIFPLLSIKQSQNSIGLLSSWMLFVTMVSLLALNKPLSSWLLCRYVYFFIFKLLAAWFLFHFLFNMVLTDNPFQLSWLFFTLIFDTVVIINQLYQSLNTGTYSILFYNFWTFSVFFILRLSIWIHENVTSTCFCNAIWPKQN